MSNRLVRVTLGQEIWPYTDPLSGTVGAFLQQAAATGSPLTNAQVVRTAATASGVDLDIVVPGSVIVQSRLMNLNAQQTSAPVPVSTAPIMVGPPTPDPEQPQQGPTWDPVLEEILYAPVNGAHLVSVPTSLQDLVELEEQEDNAPVSLLCSEDLDSASSYVSTSYVTSSSLSSWNEEDDEEDRLRLPCPRCGMPMIHTFCSRCALEDMVSEPGKGRWFW